MLKMVFSSLLLLSSFGSYKNSARPYPPEARHVSFRIAIPVPEKADKAEASTTFVEETDTENRLRKLEENSRKCRSKEYVEIKTEIAENFVAHLLSAEANANCYVELDVETYRFYSMHANDGPIEAAIVSLLSAGEENVKFQSRVNSDKSIEIVEKYYNGPDKWKKIIAYEPREHKEIADQSRRKQTQSDEETFTVENFFGTQRLRKEKDDSEAFFDWVFNSDRTEYFKSESETAFNKILTGIKDYILELGMEMKMYFKLMCSAVKKIDVKCTLHHATGTSIQIGIELSYSRRNVYKILVLEKIGNNL